MEKQQAATIYTKGINWRWFSNESKMPPKRKSHISIKIEDGKDFCTDDQTKNLLLIYSCWIIVLLLAGMDVDAVSDDSEGKLGLLT